MSTIIKNNFLKRSTMSINERLDLLKWKPTEYFCYKKKISLDFVLTMPKV